MNKVTINEILAALTANKIRATYGALGSVLGIPAIGVGSRLGVMRPQASWVVSAKNGKPSGYPEEYCHPDLYLSSMVLRTGEQLRALLEGKEVDTIEMPRKASRASPKNTLKKPQTIPVSIFNHAVDSAEAVLTGIDLAWLSDNNGSGLAVGVLNGRTLSVAALYSGILGYDNVVNIIHSVPQLSGLAIDAPLIIKNTTGNRPCEKALNATRIQPSLRYLD